ncbi:hypothetical protein [Nocardia mexicana]|uniref:Uncharacterized protein n=1 Tax=Nocardia mexicana TaxID=279262 RepID=A0A370H628_9NOCA|nr:hypothetical protein [Nocardia mexicana]RDI51541.1 hypothetical protein DFR68_10424 [Nocardia mexicana]
MTATMTRRRVVGIATQLLVALVTTAMTVVFTYVLLHQHPQGSISRPTGQQPPAATPR